MNKFLKKGIKEAFEAPVPQKKDVFFRKNVSPSISLPVFVRTQISYIRKWVFFLDLCILTIAFLGSVYIKQNMLWILSALTPLLAMAMITETGRSQICGMYELEMASRFSLKNVILARLMILGIINLSLFCLLIPISLMRSELSFVKTTIYMLFPYLMTAFCSLWASRRVHGKESTYLCMGIAVTISLANLAFREILPFLYENHSFIGWIGICFLLCTGIVKEGNQFLKETEEFQWS